MSQSTNKWLVLFDFDHTMIDVNSDTYIFEKLSPSIYNQFSIATKSTDYIGWTNLMRQQLLALSTELDQYSKQLVIDCLHTIKINHKLCNVLIQLCSAGTPMSIISDANTIFINEIIHVNQLDHIFHSNNIYTNPAQYIDNDIIDVQPYCTVSHNCIRCPSNLCKSAVLHDIKHEYNIDGTYRIIYVGDGNNDYCPSLQLTSNDIILCKSNWPLHKQLMQNHQFIHATVEQWNTQCDIADLLVKYCLDSNTVK